MNSAAANALVLGILTASLRFGGGFVDLSWIAGSIDQRRAFYSAVASVEGALLGFIIAAAALLITVDTDGGRLAKYRRTPAYRELWQKFFSATWGIALATLASLAALGLEWTLEVGRWAEAAAGAGVIGTSAHLVRCIRVLKKTIDFQNAPPAERGPHE